MLQKPVLLLIFNRPEKTEKVFEEIRKAQPKKLYIASDGPRAHVKSDLDKTNRIRDYVLRNIDWDCAVETRFLDTNLGLPYATSDAISWFFSKEDSGIILEDDTLPSQSFFIYCSNLLDFYKDDERIMNICGFNILSEASITQNSYFFSHLPHAWGWATWKRAWDKYDFSMTRFNEVDYKHLTDTHPLKVFKSSFQSVIRGHSNSCLLRWYFSIAINNGLSIIPSKSLIQNIGMDEEGTNFKNAKSPYALIKRNEISFPLQHPALIASSIEFDEFRAREALGAQVSLPMNFLKKIKNKAKKIIKNFD